MNHKFHHHKRKILYILIILLLIIGLWTIYEMRVYYAHKIIEITHPLIVDIDTGKNFTSSEEALANSPHKVVITPLGGIYFYTLTPGLNLTRQLLVANIYSAPVELETSTAGNITRFLTVDVPSQILGPNANETLTLTIRIPKENVLSGQYTGNLSIRLVPKKT